MNAVIAMLAILIGWSLVAGRLERWNVTPALAMVIAGIVLTAGSEPFVEVDVDNVISERVVEITLAVILFIDATESPAGVLGREPRLTVRLLAIALPLSFLLAFLSGLALLPGDDVWVIAVVAAVVIPTDLSPAVAIARDRRVPARLRGLLNVESGLNDGLVAPVFVFCLAAAASHEERESAGEALLNAVPEMLAALGVGAALGIAGARGLEWARAQGWTQPAALRLGVLGLPLMAYTLALALDGNGFVAAFVCGVAFASSARHFPHDALQLTEDVGTLMSLAVWFVFGQVVDQALRAGIPLEIIVYALLALTVVRIVPIVLSLVGTDVSRRDAVALGWLGSRGLASIVFGTLAYIELQEPASVVVVEAMVVTVLASVVLHGFSAAPIAAAYGRSHPVARTVHRSPGARLHERHELVHDRPGGADAGADHVPFAARRTRSHVDRREEPGLDLGRHGVERHDRDAQARAGRLLDGAVRADGERGRVERGGRQELLVGRARARSRLAQQPRPAAQVVGRHRPARQRIVRRGDQDELVGAEGMRLDPVIPGRPAGKAHIRLVLEHHLPDPAAVPHAQREPDVRAQRPEAVHELGHERLRRGGHGRDPQHPLRGVRGLLGRAPALVEQPDHVGRIGREGRPAGGRPHASALALEQRRPDFAREGRDRGRDRRLGHDELVRGRRHGAGPDHREEAPELRDRDRHPQRKA